MRSLLLGLALAMPLAFPLAISAEDDFRVTLLRATPGQLPTLIEQAKAYKARQGGQMVIMRHSQGDHWDLMLLQPAGETPTQVQDFGALVDFQHDFLSRSETTWEQVLQRAEGTNLFHIEMFHAAAGKSAELLRQRQMENRYYAATQRDGNAIFVTTFGSDVDNFTVGFYRDMAHFATDPDLPDEVFEQAARDAGFTARGNIGFYLRQLIVGHHDTLATQVE